MPKHTSSFAATLVAALFGAIFAYVFLTLNDADAMPPGNLSASKWLVVLPAALLLAMWPSTKAWASGLAMAGGIFVGTCTIAYQHDSNIWPIAGVYWMIVWTLPIVLGSAGGALAARALRGPTTR
jgi:hypothetical protein